MKILRWFVGLLLKVINALTLPKPLARTSEEQALIADALKNHSLYHLPGCPFCIKVRREAHRLQLPLEIRNINTDPAIRQALLEGGGKTTVPCLRIDHADGTTQWMYESNDIITYLKERFETPAAAVQAD